MQCAICLKMIKKSVSIDTLLSKDIHHICDRCYHAYPLYFDCITLPIDSYMMTIFVLSKIYSKQNPLAYMSYLKPYIINFIKHKRNDILLIFDDLTEDLFQMLDTLKLGDIMSVTLYISIE